MDDCKKYPQKGPQVPVEGLPLAMAYVPWQRWGSLYSPEKGFAQGTIFKELDYPFYGKGGCRR